MTRFRVVTGTDTGIGKTVVTAALACATGGSVAVVKPVQTGLPVGEPGDAAEVGRLAGVPFTELVRLPEALAPESAAHRSGASLPTVADLAEHLAAEAEADTVLVEGAGGVAVRLDRAGGTVVGLATALEWHGDVDAVVVVRAGLGTLSAAELAVDLLRRHGVSVAGLVIGSWPDDPGHAELVNLEDLPRLTGAPLLGRVPAGAGTYDPERFRREAPSWFEPSAT